jgi:hypothetical protein
MRSPSSSASKRRRAESAAQSERLRVLRLRLLSQLDQKYGREKAVLRKTIRSLEERLRRDGHR